MVYFKVFMCVVALHVIAGIAWAGEDYRLKYLEAQREIAQMKVIIAELQYERNVLNAYSFWTKNQALEGPRREIRQAAMALEKYKQPNSKPTEAEGQK